MNKIYRIVWNHAKRTWIVASKLSRSANKSNATNTSLTTNIIKLSTLSLALSAGFASAATYSPTYGPYQIITHKHLSQLVMDLKLTQH